jgi:YVTN family beta-propeller protein
MGANPNTRASHANPRRKPFPALGKTSSQPTTKTDDPSPKTTSAAVKIGSSTPQLRFLTSSATSSVQLQEDYPILLPLPLGPLFTSASVAAYTPSCAQNVFVYAVGYGNSTVTKYATCPFAAVKVFQVPSNPIQVEITPDGSTAVVTSYNNAISFINTSADTVTTLSTPLYNPYGLAITPDGSRAYVTSYSTAQPVIFQVNLSTGQLLPQTLQVNSFPKSIFLTPDGALAWVNFSQSSSIYVIDTLSMTVAATINAGGTADTGMAFSPDGTRACVSVFGGSVSVFNTDTLAMVASIPVGDQPTGILVTKDGSRVYVNSFAATDPPPSSTRRPTPYSPPSPNPAPPWA